MLYITVIALYIDNNFSNIIKMEMISVDIFDKDYFEIDDAMETYHPLFHAYAKLKTRFIKPVKSIEDNIGTFQSSINVKNGSPCKYIDAMSDKTMYYIYKIPVPKDAYDNIMDMHSDMRQELYIPLSSHTSDSRPIFKFMDKYVDIPINLNKSFSNFDFMIFYSTNPHANGADNKHLYVVVAQRSAGYFVEV